jgi:hypothetical protein
MLEAILRAQAVAAVKGNVRAQREFVAAARAAEREENAERRMLLAGVIEYKLAWEAEFRRCKEHGTKEPEPALHPDDLVLEETTGKVHIRGPATAKEGARWRSLRRTLRADLRDLEAQRDDPAHRKRGETSSDIQRTEKVLSIVEKALAGSHRAMLVLEQALKED